MARSTGPTGSVVLIGLAAFWFSAEWVSAGCPVDSYEQSRVRVANHSGVSIYLEAVADAFAPGDLPNGAEREFCYDPAAMSFSFGGYDSDRTWWSQIGISAPGDPCLGYLLILKPGGAWEMTGSFPKPCHARPSPSGPSSQRQPTGGQSPPGLTRAAAEALGNKAKSLWQQVRQGSLTAAEAGRRLDSFAGNSGIASSAWSSYRTTCTQDFAQAERNWLADQDRRRQIEASRAAGEQKRLAAEAQSRDQARQRQIVEQQRKQDELRYAQAQWAQAQQQLRQQAEEQERQRKAELQRKLDELAEKNRRALEINQANQQIISESFGAGVASASSGIEGKRSAMVSKVVSGWRAPKSYAGDQNASVALVDPFESAPAAAAKIIEVDPGTDVVLESVKGVAQTKRILLASPDPTFRPVVCAPEVPGLWVAIEPVKEGDKQRERASHQFAMSIGAAGKKASVPPGATVRVATGLSAEPVIEVHVLVVQK